MTRDTAADTRRCSLSIVLLVLLNVAANVIVCPLVFQFDSAGGWLWDLADRMLFFAIAPSQGALLAVAAILPGRMTPWRLVGVVVVLASWSRVPGANMYQLGSPKEVSLLISNVLSTGLLLVILRSAGISLRYWGADDDPERSGSISWKAQFSLRAVLEWTAASAVILGALTYVRDETVSHMDPTSTILMGAVLSGLPTALIAATALWAALGRRHLGMRVIVFGLATTVVVVLYTCLYIWVAPGQTELWQLFLGLFLCAVWLSGSLWVVRMSGYRLANRQ